LTDTPGKAYYGIFTRIVEASGEVKTAIMCNHGPATSAIAKYLFSDRVATDLIPRMCPGDWEGLPESYQLLFQATLAQGTKRQWTAKLVCDCVIS